jgi:hypothetical protein
MRQIKNRTLACENRHCIVTQSLRNGSKNESSTHPLNSVFVVDLLYRLRQRLGDPAKRERETAHRTEYEREELGP